MKKAILIILICVTLFIVGCQSRGRAVAWELETFNGNIIVKDVDAALGILEDGRYADWRDKYDGVALRELTIEEKAELDKLGIGFPGRDAMSGAYFYMLTWDELNRYYRERV